jgi:hypothetical protein
MGPFSPIRAIRALPAASQGFVMRILWPWSLLRKSMLFANVDPNEGTAARLGLESARLRHAGRRRLVRSRRSRRTARLRLRDEQYEPHMFDDPREKALRDAVHRSIRRLTG